MHAKDAMKFNMGMGHYVLQKYLSDLSDVDLLLRVMPGVNHAAWQLGHLICSEREMLTAVGGKMPELPAGFAEAHNKEAAASPDNSRFGKKQTYLDLMGRMRAATLATLEGMSDAQLNAPAPEAMRDYAPKVGDVFTLLGGHDLMHAGQFVALRRKLGKPVLI